MLKRLSLLLLVFFIALICMPILIQADITNSTPVSIISNAGSIISGIKTQGGKWFLNIPNLFFALGFLIGIGYIIVKTTTTKKDDIWYGKYILKPWRFIGNVLTWFGISGTTKKK